MPEIISDRVLCIRKYQPQDKEKIISLYNLVFQRSRTLEDWKWEFEDNPAGEAVIWVAEDQDKIVGCYSGLPVKIKIAGQAGTSYQIVDLMTHPDYRQAGIHVRLGLAALQEIASQSNKNRPVIIHGFPAKIAFKIGQKYLRYTQAGSIPKLVRILSKEAVLQKRVKFRRFFSGIASVMIFLLKLLHPPKAMPGSSRLSVSKIERFKEDADELWNSLSKEFNIALIRNKEYLNWRYASRPGSCYEAFTIKDKSEYLGYIILECKGREGFIVDLLAKKDDRVLFELLDFSLGYFKTKGASKVTCYISDRFYIRALKRLGFIERPFSFFRHGTRNFAADVPDSLINDSSNWFLTYADTEL